MERGRRERGRGNTHPVLPEGGQFLPVDQHTQPEMMDPSIWVQNISLNVEKNRH